MNLKSIFWKKPNPIDQAADRALASLDAALPGSASDDDFMQAASLIAAQWCTKNMEGQTLSREASLRRAEKLYHAVNGKIYNDTVPDHGFIILGG